MPRYKTSVEEEPHQTPTVAVTTVDDRLRSRKSRTGPQQHQQYLPASNDPHRDAETRHSTSSAPPVHLPLYSPMMVESSADARWWMWWWRWCSCERSVPWFRSAHVQIRHVAHRIRSSPSAVRILDWIRRHIYLVVFSLGFLLIQLIYNPLSARQIDHQLTFAVMSRYFAEQQRHLQSMGVMLPPVKVDFANVINTHAALREVLIRRQARMRTLQQLELNATAIQSNCLQASTCRYMVPRVLFVPGVLNWESTRPGRLQSHNVTILTFDDTERQRLVQVMSMLLDHSAGTPITAAAATSLSTLYHQMTDEGDKILLWSLCAVYAYGGYFVGNYLDLDLTRMRLVEDILLRDPNDATIHPSPVAVLLLESGLVSKRNDNIRLLAASPRSGALGCLLVNLLQSDNKGSLGFVRRLLPFVDWQQTPSLSRAYEWQRWTRVGENSRGDLSICQSAMAATTTTASDIWQELLASSATDCALYTRILRFSNQEHEAPNKMSTEHESAITVEIQERAPSSNRPRTKQKKVTLQSQMRTQGVEPGWLCNRCLGWAARGTYETCALYCPSGLKRLMCEDTNPDQLVNIDIDVMVQGWVSTMTNSSRKAIPRIIHQTWFEEITLDRYPQLARLQHSWKSSGWEFRFYTDETARQYIATHYPAQFVEAFDALIHGAFKADLFRYLVLLREGGVYADVDVKLDGFLDSVLTSTTTFFAPRDIPCEYAGEAFCLWNGFIGAAPGSPVMVRVVERLINLIQQRADIYDMEREACLRAGSAMKVWKVRAQPLLFLSGPCALGVAVNEALHRSPLESIPIGWLGLNQRDAGNKVDVGDILVLVGDKYDLGQFRVSHPDSGAMVAATDIVGLDKSPRNLLFPSAGDLRRLEFEHKPLPHYSNSKRGVSVWGMKNVYHDDLVGNELVRLHVQYIQ